MHTNDTNKFSGHSGEVRMFRVGGLMEDINKPTQSNQKDLEEKLSLAEKERDEYLNGWKRAKADFVNAKKEWSEQLSNLNFFVKADFIKTLLPIIDAFEAAEKQINGWQEIKSLLEGILKENGFKEIEALDKKFDPVYHEAVAEIEGEEGKVIEIVQKGYLLDDQVIRPVRVKVGKQVN